MSDWTFADIWEAVASVHPDAAALIHGERRHTWRELDEQAAALARFLVDRGAGRQDKVALYLYNAPEYVIAFAACSKASLVHVNTNYRYVDDELLHVWADSGATAVIFHASFTESVARVRERADGVATWIWVDDGTGECPPWATSYADVLRTDTSEPLPYERSGDDLVLLYTGGTTGRPKGVMWRQDDLIAVIDKSNRTRLPLAADLDHAARAEAVRARTAAPGPRSLTACPLMHGTGLFNSLNTLNLGGSLITLTKPRFDVVELLDVIERESAKGMFIVGDAFAQPIVRALDAEPSRWDISSLRVVISSGVMWSAETKQAMLRHNPKMLLVDTYGSSEAIGMGSSVATSDRPVDTARFELSDRAVVIDDDGDLVTPGSGRIGRVAISGPGPIGYYGDPEKSAATFPVINGVRYSVPGDFAEVDADGSIRLLGRGSSCINTAGEKVFPEEVEEVLKSHPAVLDAVVVGAPDERFGQVVTAVVQLGAPLDDLDAELTPYVKARLAGFKAPRRVYAVADLERAANGKIDHRRWSQFVATAGQSAPAE